MHAVVAPEKCITFTLLFLLFSNLESFQPSTCFIVESPSMTMLSLLTLHLLWHYICCYICYYIWWFFSKLFLMFDIFCNSTFSVVMEFSKLKVHWCRFENLTIYSNSYKNNTMKNSHSWPQEFSSYSSVKFVFFLKSRLIFNVFYCFCMFVNKDFANFTGI